LQYDALHSLTRQKLREQQAGRPGADDHHLSLAHDYRSSGAMVAHRVRQARSGGNGLRVPELVLFSHALRPAILQKRGPIPSAIRPGVLSVWRIAAAAR